MADTIRIGEEIAKLIPLGSVIVSSGDLGAGKTALAKGIAKGLGIDDTINSPTFVIIKTYEGNKANFYHIDAYRLETEEELVDIGFDDILGEANSISYVEWGQFIKPHLNKVKKNLYSIKIQILDNYDRKFVLEDIYE